MLSQHLFWASWSILMMGPKIVSLNQNFNAEQTILTFTEASEFMIPYAQLRIHLYFKHR